MRCVRGRTGSNVNVECSVLLGNRCFNVACFRSSSRRCTDGAVEIRKQTEREQLLNLEYRPSTNAALMYQIDQCEVEALM